MVLPVCGVAFALIIALNNACGLLRQDMPAIEGKPGDMVEVPAGEFIVGCPPQWNNDTQCTTLASHPYQTISLPAFSIDRFEVTVGQYKACVDAGGCETPKPLTEGAYHEHCNFGVSGREQHPINCVSFVEAAAFCAWAGKRLPTSLEWEKAARGTDGRYFPWGDAPHERDFKLYGNVKALRQAYVRSLPGKPDIEGMLAEIPWPATAPVGSFPGNRSPYGVYDMAGNVKEFAAPTPGIWDATQETLLGHPPGADTVATRGGYWADVAFGLATMTVMPRGQNSRSASTGFRCAG